MTEQVEDHRRRCNHDYNTEVDDEEHDQDQQQLSTSPKTVVDATSLFLSSRTTKTKAWPVPTATAVPTTEKNNKLLTLEEFIHELPNVIQERKIHNIPPGALNDPICNLFRRTDWSLNNSWIHKYAFFDTSKPYTRNLIHTDNQHYTLLMLCWNPNEESPIHDHPCDGCWMQCIKGSVRECRYDSTTLKCISETTVKQGELAYITDSMGLHKVGNPSSNVPAITIHLYSPPFQKCTIWCSRSSRDGGATTTSNKKMINSTNENQDTEVANNSMCSLDYQPTSSYAHHYSEYGHVI